MRKSLKIISYLVAGIILILGNSVCVSFAEDQVLTGPNIISEVFVFFTQDKFDSLDSMGDKFVKENTRTKEGNWAIARYFASLAQAYPGRDKFLARCDEWLKANPRSAHAHVAKANYLTALAWDLRGSGYASASSKEQLDQFSKTIKRALQEANEALKIAPHHQEALNVQLYLTLAAGDPDHAAQHMIDSLLKEYPTYFPIHRTVTGFLRPQWGESYAEMESYAAHAASSVKNDESDYIYSYIADYASRELGERTYGITPFQWDKVKSGYEQELAKFPDSPFLPQLFELHAWYAGDKGTAKLLIARYGNSWKPEMTESFRTQDSFDKFKSWAASETVGPAQKIFTIQDAVAAGDVERIKRLIAGGADFNGQDDKGQTPLMVAISSGHTDVALELIRQKADLLKEDKNGYTAAHYAVAIGNMALIEPLKPGWSDFSVIREKKFSIMHLAAKLGQIDILKEILRLYPLGINVPDRDGNTPLIYAVLCQKPEMVKFLISLPSVTTSAGPRPDGMSALHLAALYGNKEIAQIILDKGEYPKALNKAGKTAEEVARDSNHQDIADLIKNTKWPRT